MSRERADTGEFVETVTDERVLGVFTAVEGPVVTTSDVAERLGCTTEAARRKLNELDREGRVGKRKTAGRVVYWVEDHAEPRGIDPDDDFWHAEPVRGSEGMSAEEIDDVLYGPVENE